MATSKRLQNWCIETWTIWEIKRTWYSIIQVSNLDQADFSCRFMILEESANHFATIIQPTYYTKRILETSTLKRFQELIKYIILQLTYPEVLNKTDNWKEYLSELKKVHTKGDYKGSHDNVVFSLVNTINFVVPQKKGKCYHCTHYQ
ncbi:MAG: hypothetical protein WCP85_07415 [Mariniphaga sp.]